MEVFLAYTLDHQIRVFSTKEKREEFLTYHTDTMPWYKGRAIPDGITMGEGFPVTKI